MHRRWRGPCWLQRHAVSNNEANVSRAFLLIEDGADEDAPDPVSGAEDAVIGHFTLLMASLRKQELSSDRPRLKRGSR